MKQMEGKLINAIYQIHYFFKYHFLPCKDSILSLQSLCIVKLLFGV
jgi:hypothetical protein